MSSRIILLGIFVQLALLCAVLAQVPNAPVWPQQYYVRGTFQLPYYNLTEPLDIWYDAKNNRERIDYYNGMNSYVWRFDLNVLYQVVPRIDQLICVQSSQDSGSALTTVLPDLSDWSYTGTQTINGIYCHNWQKIVTNFNKTATYNFFLDYRTMEPVQLHLYGYDFVFGSHPDVYVLTYDEYEPSLVSDQVFNMPSICKNSAKTVKDTMSAKRSGIRALGMLGQLQALTPFEINDEFDMFALKHKKVYINDEEKAMRRNIYEKNKRYIESHNNKPGVTYKMAMNHLGDLTQDEINTLIKPKPSVSRAEANRGGSYHQMSGKTLPASVNWVEKGAVTKVKDQGVCGSCWTFGTTGSIEGAYAVKYGKLLSLSEQQIVDCGWLSWGGAGGDSGCDGGYASGAIQWIIDNGGIALEQTYKYLMIDHFCNTEDRSSGITIKSYVNVTEGSEAALMDAIATNGPTAVAIDASHPSFSFYSSGVYYEPQCANDLDDLDHEVLAVGYGTENGQDYFLVKNSWSTYWGDQGYVKMSRNRGNNCGIATQATYPVV